MGFGLIVVLFVATVFVMRSYVSVVEEGSVTLADKVSKMLRLSTVYNIHVNEIFMAMRAAQYRESQESIKAFKDDVEKTKSVEQQIIELNKKYPELPGAANAVSKLLPQARLYVEHAERTFAQISKKQDLLNGFLKAGNDMSTIAETMHKSIYNKLKNNIGRLYAGADQTEAQNMADAMALCANIVESIMASRRNAWRSFAHANAGGSLDEVKALSGEAKVIQDQAATLRPLLANSPEEAKELEQLLSNLKSYEDYLSKIAATYVELVEIHSARAPVLDSFNKECNTTNDLSVSRVEDVSKENIENLNTATFVMWALTIASAIFALIIALFISRSISSPLNRIVKLAKRAGEGDLTVRKADFGYDGMDEMGSMVAALAEMIDSQSSTMNGIVKIAEDLAGGASNLSAISEETNASMEEIKASITQAKDLSEANGAALEESNAGVEEMSAGADTVARSATDSAAFISQTTDASNTAIETVRGVISGMRDVDKNSKVSEGKIQQLVSSVENVSSFVSVITGIADQTNLLALNAAIEAARAGEVGRGFAVVAEEVRKLAEESARAAQNVNGIIKELQTGAQESIKATTEAGALLASTLTHAEEALGDLNGAMDQINKANDSIQNIAAIAEEQAASSKEVAQAIDNATKASVNIVGTISSIHNATDETAQATEGVAKHAELMTTYSSTLSELLSKFKLDIQTGSTKMLAGR